MKKFIVVFFSFSLILFQTTYAQNWQLFPFNQLDYFASPDTSTSFNNIYEYKNDSITIAGNTNVLHFNRFPVAENHSNCLYTAKIMLGDTLEFDSLVEWNNNYHYFFISDTATFPSLALPGDSLIINCANGGSNFNRVKLTCDSLKSGSVFGVTDSIKYFSIRALLGNAPVNYYNNYTYKLSKTFGLLNFIPFRYWLCHPAGITLPTYTIKGLEDSTQTLGFHLPTFEDYIHYRVGEVYKWDNYPGIYARDSITNVQQLHDTVRIFYNETSVFSLDTFYTTKPMVEDFAKHNFEDIIDKTYPHLGFSPMNAGIICSTSMYFVYPNNNFYIDSCFDTLINFGTGSFVDSSCIYTPPFEWNESYVFSTAAGFTQYFTSDAGDWYEAILNGFKTATTSCGDYSQIITGINQLPINNEHVNVYPNPTSNQITISSNQFPISQLQIENVLGQTVLLYTPQPPEGGVRVDVSNLPEGIYFYRVTDSNLKVVTGKFVLVK